MTQEVYHNNVSEVPKEAREQASSAHTARLDYGSDVEIAQQIAAALSGAVSCEGDFWRYIGTHWEAIPKHEVERRAMDYDGCCCSDGTRVKLNDHRIKSILAILAATLAQPDFFAERVVGINCANGFIRFDEEGEPNIVAHADKHRQRHVLPGRWQPGSTALDGSMLDGFFARCFLRDPEVREKVDLLGEVAGAAALGYGTRLANPMAVILLGRTAENGKSQVLALLHGLLPRSAISEIPPSEFGDKHSVVCLAGKLLNTSGELGTAGAISSDRFKSIITGEGVHGRSLYSAPTDVHPEAQHVFACNQLPSFRGGMDRGVRRRLLVVEFDRTIPESERIPDIGGRIAREEPDLLLAWTVEGAARLLKRGRFAAPVSSQRALDEWSQSADPVLGWFEDRIERATLTVVGGEKPRLSTKAAYDDFVSWSQDEGYSERELPKMRTISQRVRATLPKEASYCHSGNFRGFEGVSLKRRSRAANDIPQLAA